RMLLDLDLLAVDRHADHLALASGGFGRRAVRNVTPLDGDLFVRHRNVEGSTLFDDVLRDHHLADLLAVLVDVDMFFTERNVALTSRWCSSSFAHSLLGAAVPTHGAQAILRDVEEAS